MQGRHPLQTSDALGAARVHLGADFDGVLVRDGWTPYRRFTEALHQTCLAHLLRRARTLRADHPRSPPGRPACTRC